MDALQEESSEPRRVRPWEAPCPGCRSLAEEHCGLSRVGLPSFRLVKAGLAKAGFVKAREGWELVRTCEGKG